MIELDENAGLPMDQNALQIYTLYSMYNNVYGFGDQKRQLEEEIEKTRRELRKFLGFDRVFYNSGATESIQTIFRRIPNICVCEGEHPSVHKLESDFECEDGICLCCLVSSSTSEIEFKKKSDDFPYIILDVSEAIGKVKCGQSEAGLPKQGENNTHCIFFSSHKLGGPKRSGFLACSDEFYNKYLLTIQDIKEDKEDGDDKEDSEDKKKNYELHPDLEEGGSFDIAGFMSASHVVFSLEIPPKKLMYETHEKLKQILESFPEIKNIKPIIENLNNINDYPNAFSSLTFELKDICPRSFEHVLENNGLEIGFETACQSNETGVLRLSWRQPVEEIDIIKSKFEEAFAAQLSGGSKKEDDFLDDINRGGFWLVSHFVPSQDKTFPEISEKYRQMFEYDLLKEKVSISLKIPPHTPAQKEEFNELEKRKKKLDFKEIRPIIEKRRLSAFLWINNPDAEYELSLENFEKDNIDIELTNEVLEYVENNRLKLDKRLETFEEETKEYTVEIKNYPHTLLEEIRVNDTKFMISLYNLKLLSGKNNLSVAILQNLELKHKKGESVSKFYIPHECIVQNDKYMHYQNCLGSLLTSMRLMKEMDPMYPRLNPECVFNKPQSKFESNIKENFTTESIEENVIIEELDDTDISEIIEFIEKNKPKHIVIYLPNIYIDEIEEEYGLYYYFKKNGFSYEIEYFEYYDVWTHEYKQDKEIVMFMK